MLLSNKKLILIIIILMLPVSVFSKITESQLRGYRSLFLSKIINDNIEKEMRIRKCLNGIVKDNGGGIRLIDKFGLFVHDIKRNQINIQKIKFFFREKICIFFIVLIDKGDGQLYTLFLEYEFMGINGKCILKDVYFSLVFNEKMKEIENFFNSR